ncbi:DNA polymerase III delta subunit [Alicyclobacillus sacchari]|uniref:DNA polymerase III subunit delta n=1 Tax=Alicyclobacillus sacchari TaxID=392010 RepID=A0A4R8LP24_9BACL|nr:DNA polymerase III subunit delta [Alicyclobacillus sacchari]TDY48031.1 DNA polymerase III delta subunit [Alicyclobacillus sacchari]GMA56168.1 DNA polymerase III subunit delta [Alicyclobacillus sacchari]
MDVFQAMEELNANRLASVYVLYGSEIGLVDLFCDRAARSGGFTSVARFDYEEDGFEQARLELDTLSFFSDQALVHVRNCTALTSQGKSGSDLEALEAYLENPAPGRVLVLSTAADKLDERKRITKTAKRHVVVQCATPKEADALRHLKSFAKERGIEATDEAIHELWRRVGAMTHALNELEKLSVYALGRRIERTDVEQLVVRSVEDSVFDWIDRVAQGQIAAALTNLQGLARQGYDPLALMALLARQIRMMGLAKSSADGRVSLDQLAKRAGVHPFAMRVAAKQAQRFTLRDLEMLARRIADSEYDVKRGRRDPQQALECILMEASLAAITRSSPRVQ